MFCYEMREFNAFDRVVFEGVAAVVTGPAASRLPAQGRSSGLPLQPAACLMKKFRPAWLSLRAPARQPHSAGAESMAGNEAKGLSQSRFAPATRCSARACARPTAST